MAVAFSSLRLRTLFVSVLIAGSTSTVLAAATATTTVLAVTSAGSAVTSVNTGTVVTLTATVKAGSTSVTVGQVNFCDAAAKDCTGSHLLGAAQLTGVGAATLKFVPAIGSHSYKAIFLGTTSQATSSSSVSGLIVNAIGTGTGTYPTNTTISSSGTGGTYTLTATVAGSEGTLLPTGAVSFLNASNGNNVLGTVSLADATKGITFVNSSNPSTGNLPYAIAEGDFNGDGILDLAVANTNDDTVTILLGDGHGSFQTASETPHTDIQPEALAVGDFNRDGKLDLAVGNYNGDSVTVLLGNGDGTFTGNSDDFLIGSSNAIASADFNGDGLLDLAIPITGGDIVEIQQGIGSGGFDDFPQDPPSTQVGPPSIALADFNGDGVMDMAVANAGSNTVTVLLGYGDGSFTAAATPATGKRPISVAVGDFNGDGKADIVTADALDSTVTVLLGNGDGTFTVAASLLTGNTPKSIAAGDINGDGNMDLVALNSGDSTVTVFLGNGNGTFTAAATQNTGFAPQSVVVADFNGDGLADIAVACAGSQSVTVLLTQLTQTVKVTGIVSSGSGEEVTAQYSGDPSFKSSTSSEISLTGAKIATTTTLTSSTNPQVVGESVTFTVAVTPASGIRVPTGTITETINGSPGGTVNLIGGSATLVTSDVPVGNYTIVVTYSGDANFLVSSSVPLVQVITSASTTATPTFSPVAGTYTLAQSVTITDSTTGAAIYYTTNGTTPTTSSTKYTGAIAVSSSESIQAIAVVTGYSNSAVASASYTIKPFPLGALQFIALTPCRIADTRGATGTFGGPELAAAAARTFDVPQSGCGIPASAVAYSLNATVVPNAGLGYLTIWPAGEPQPTVSTLNSDGRVKANATITPAGNDGGVSVYASDATQFILDIDGYFVPAGTSASELEFFPLTPCRVADTRNPTGSLGGPSLTGNTARSFPVQSSACGIPSTAQAYSLNVTAVPHESLGFLSLWPSGEAQPVVSTLNASTGAVTANAAIVPAGAGGDVSILVSDASDVILDVNGYFAPPAAGGLSLYTVTPCRALDTRNSSAFDGTLTVPIHASACAPPTTAQAYVLNATALPVTSLSYLTLWAAGGAQPGVSTLNASDGAITSNMAIVPTTNGNIDAFSTDSTNLLLDLSSYFAP